MKKMKRAALAMASVTAISLVGCGGSNTTTTADTKAAGESSAEGGNSGDISGNITFSFVLECNHEWDRRHWSHDLA